MGDSNDGYIPLVPRNSEGREITEPVIPEDFSEKYLSAALPVGDYSTVDSSTIIFVFDLFETLVDSSGVYKRFAVDFIRNIKRICENAGKTTLFFIYSEYLNSKEERRIVTELETHIGSNFKFDSRSRIKKGMPQIKEYDTVLEIYANKFAPPETAEIEEVIIHELNYPVFFFDDSLNQVKSMYSTARAAFSSSSKMYFRAFHISENSSWNDALIKIIQITHLPIPARYPMVPPRPPSLALTSESDLKKHVMPPSVMPPSLIQSSKKGGNKTRKNKRTPAKKSRKNLKNK